MTGTGRDAPGPDAPGDGSERRRARIRTEHDEAAVVAAAIRPDNTESIRTRVEGDAVVTDVARETTGGLQATVDDYVVNLMVAETVARTARQTPYDNNE